MDLGCKVSTFAFVRPKLSRTIIFVFPLLPSMLGLGSYAKCARTHATQKSYVTFVHASIKCGMLGVRWYFFFVFYVRPFEWLRADVSPVVGTI